MIPIAFTLRRPAGGRRWLVRGCGFAAMVCLLTLANGVELSSRPALGFDGVWVFATDPDRIGEKEQWFRPDVTRAGMPRPGYCHRRSPPAAVDDF